MSRVDVVREMHTRMKIKRRIDANRIAGAMGFREHFSSHPGRHSWTLCGHPVYWWVMKMATEVKYIEKVVVFTEDKKAQETAREMSDKFVIFNRTMEECKEPMWRFVDDLKTNKSRINTLGDWVDRPEVKELLGFEPTLFVYLQANQPLVRARTVTRQIEKYFEDDIAEAVYAAVKDYYPASFYIRDPEFPEYLIRCGFIGGSRQEEPTTYKPFGHPIMPYKNRIISLTTRMAFVEVGKDEVSDIHDEEDLAWAEFKMRRRLEKEGGGK